MRLIICFVFMLGAPPLQGFIVPSSTGARGMRSWSLLWSSSGGSSRRSRESEKIDVGALLRNCQRRNDYSAALEFANDLETKQDLTALTATTIIRLYGEAHQLGKAISVLQRMKTCGIDANERHYGALIHAARKAGQWEMAIGLFDRMLVEGIRANTIVYNSMISTFADVQRLDLVDEYLERMSKDGVKKDTYTYSAAITACERSLEWKKALDLFENMEGEGVEANVVVLNSVLNACVKGRKWRVAMDLLARSREMGIRPDTISYSSVITALGDAGRVDVALRLFSDMDSDGGTALLTQFSQKMKTMKPTTLNQAGGKTKCNSNSNSEDSASDSGADECQRNPAPWGPVKKDTGAYNAAITACERNGQHEKALTLLRLMLEESSGVRADGRSFSAAIAACGNAGEWKQALGLFNMMEQTGVPRDTVVYNTIIAALQQAGQFTQAKGLEGDYPGDGDSAAGPGIAGAGGREKGKGKKQGVSGAGGGPPVGATMRYSPDMVGGRPPSSSREQQLQTGVPRISEEKEAESVLAQKGAGAGAGEGAGAEVGGPALQVQQMPRYAQELYIQGLSEGMLKHWGKGSEDGGGGARGNNDAPDGATSSSSSSGGDESASLTDATELLYWWQDVVNSELLPAGQRAIESGSTTEMKEVLDKLNFESFRLGDLSCADDDGDGTGGGGGGASNGGKGSFYKEMDLHGFPLSVAKAAIDFVFSEIAERACTAGGIWPKPGVKEGSTSIGDIDPSLYDIDNDSSNGNDDDGEEKEEEEDYFDLEKALSSINFDLKIVTGRGKHTNSSGTRGVLRGEIEQYLLHGVRPVGCLSVTRVSGNDGVLVVSRSSVRTWLRAKLEVQLGERVTKRRGAGNGNEVEEEPAELQ